MGHRSWVPTGCWGSVWLIRYWAERRQGGRSAWLPCPAPASLPFWILGWLPGRDHRHIFSPHSLCTGWKRAGSKRLGLAGLPAAQGAGQKPAPSQGPRGIHPPGCASRTHWIKPGRLRPPGPSLLAPKAAEGWSSAGSPPGSASFYHPSPSCLQSWPAPQQEWHGAGMPHRPPAPSRTRTELSIWVPRPRRAGGAGGLGPREQEEWL